MASRNRLRRKGAGGFALACVVALAPVLIVGFGCDGVPYVELRSGKAYSPLECLSCHATHQPSDPPCDISHENEILWTHYDDVFIDELGRLVYKDTTTAFPDGNPHFVYRGDGGSIVPLFPVTPAGALIPSNPEDAKSAPVVDDASTTSSDLAAVARIEGHVLPAPLAWAPSGFGYASLTDADGNPNPQGCAASCHAAHAEALLPLKQWARARMAYTHSPSFARALPGPCQRCHSGIAYALYVDPTNAAFPDFTPTPGISHWVDCNACHDGVRYPTKAEPALRFQGAVAYLTAGSATARPPNLVPPVALPADRNSGTCVPCHQTRETGQSLALKIDGWLKGAGTACDGVDSALTRDAAFGAWAAFDPHPGGQTNIQYSQGGFEYPGKTYSPGYVMHQMAGCIGCHMIDKSQTDADPLERGGHTMNAAGCERCHQLDYTVATFGEAGRIVDVDGNGQAEHPKAEMQGLLLAVITAMGTHGLYYNPAVSPFVYDTPDPNLQRGATSGHVFSAWTESLAKAYFNMLFVRYDRGAYSHNFRYCAQLLWDSLEDLGSPSAGVRPATMEDRRGIVCP